MTTADSPFREAAPDAARPMSEFWDRLNVWLERASEKLNPILVKEARQALKSRQFAVTFTLLLVCAWCWSMLGVVTYPEIRYNPGGFYMLIGYFWILAFPLIVVVPFSAYRSLAMEREDGTYELIAVTTLTPGQIVRGKLGSAVIQMLVYFSALAPCIAFTYMLRGIDILTVGLILFYSFLVSLCLSALGLLLATATKHRHWQVLFSVVLIVGLATGFVFASFMVFLWYVEGGGYMPLDDVEFWIGNGITVAMLVCYFLLTLQAATARMTFISENRSTKLRMLMLLQQVVYVFCLTYVWVQAQHPEVIFVFHLFAALHWTALGTLLTGEFAQLSHRARRSLPYSVFGRVFLSLFNPGPGSGYLFFVANMAVIYLLGLAGAIYLKTTGRMTQTFGPGTAERIYMFGLLSFCYPVAYLGTGRLLIALLRSLGSKGRVTMLGGALIHVVLILFGVLMPFTVQKWVVDRFMGDGYTVLQAPNWLWTFYELLDRDLFLHSFSVAGVAVPIVAVIVAMYTAVIFFLNMLAAAGEFRYEREATPERIRADDRELHPEPVPEKPAKASPWD